jgi:transposase-like protein
MAKIYLHDDIVHLTAVHLLYCTHNCRTCNFSLFSQTNRTASQSLKKISLKLYLLFQNKANIFSLKSIQDICMRIIL